VSGLTAGWHRVTLREHVGVEVGLVDTAGEAGGGGEADTLSIMQPRSTRQPSRRAAAIIASAGEIPPHFISLMLMPSTQPRRAARVSGPWTSSSA
jgi:hypothetical protein